MGKSSSAAAQREAIFPRGRAGAATAALSLPLAWCVRLVPYSRRIPAALRLATPLTAAATVLGGRTALSGLTVRERMIGRVLSMLQYRRVDFPADVTVAGTAAVNGPLLVLVRHSLLNQLVISKLVRAGVPVSMVMNDPPPRYRVFGGDADVDALPVTPMLMRLLAHTLQRGRIVFVAIDVEGPQAGFTKVETASGPWFLADQPIRLALKLRVPIAVAVHSLSGTSVTTELRTLSGEDTGAIIKGFCAAFGVTLALHEPSARR